MPDRDHLPRPPVRRRRRDVPPEPPAPPPGRPVQPPYDPDRDSLYRDDDGTLFLNRNDGTGWVFAPPGAPRPTRRISINGVDQDVQIATKDSPQPAPGIPGRLSYAPETDLLYRDNGSEWEILGAPWAATVSGTRSGIDPTALPGFRAFDAAVRARVGQALTTEMRAVEQAAREQILEANGTVRAPEIARGSPPGVSPVPYAAAAQEAVAVRPTRLPEPPDRIDVTTSGSPFRQYIGSLPVPSASAGLDRWLYGRQAADPEAGPWRPTGTPGVWEQDIPIPGDRSVLLVTEDSTNDVEIDAAITALRIEMTIDGQLRFTLEGQALNPVIIGRLQSMYNNNRRVRLVLALGPDD